MFNEGIFFALYCITLWLGHRAYISIKAKAFNEGYKRGRASINVREIVKWLALGRWWHPRRQGAWIWRSETQSITHLQNREIARYSAQRPSWRGAAIYRDQTLKNGGKSRARRFVSRSHWIRRYLGQMPIFNTRRLGRRWVWLAIIINTNGVTIAKCDGDNWKMGLGITKPKCQLYGRCNLKRQRGECRCAFTANLVRMKHRTGRTERSGLWKNNWNMR